MTDDGLPRSLRPAEGASDAEIATHIAEACRELRSLFHGPESRTLSGILDMARAEAERVARNAEVSGR